MNRCRRCNAALSPEATSCPRCGNALGREDAVTELSDDDLIAVECSTPDGRRALGYDPRKKRRDGTRDDSAAFGRTDEPELELAAVLPYQERAKKKQIEEKEGRDEQKERKEIQKLAGYGEPPRRVADAVLYLLWFIWRQFALRLALKNLARKRKTEQSVLDAAYRAAGESLHERHREALLTACGEELRAIAEAQEKMRIADEQDLAVRQSVSQDMEYVADSIYHTQKNTEPFRAQEARLSAELKRYEDERARIDAEIRSAKQAYEELIKESKGEPDAGLRDRVERALRARKSRLAELAERIDGISIDLEEVRIELGDAVKKVHELHEQRKSSLAKRMTSAQLREAERRKAEQALVLALQALGRRGSQEIPELITAPRAEAICKAADSLNATDMKIELHRRALASYDRQAVARGSLLLVALFALLIASLIAFRVVFGSPRVGEKLPPPPPSSLPVR